MKSSDIHIRVISQEVPQPSITEICLKITCLKIHSNLPGVNELIKWLCFQGKNMIYIEQCTGVGLNLDGEASAFMNPSPRPGPLCLVIRWVAVIVLVPILITISWALVLKLLIGEFFMTPWIISWYWFNWWLSAWWHQAITWANVDPDLCDHNMPSLGHKDFNSLWPSDAIWRQRSGSTLAQVMACCLTAPSYYLNQCWLIISKAQ